MARTINVQDFAQKRSAILDAAQRLVYTKGYERMTIQEILQEVQISSGAFYHYFESKPAVLEAFIERIQQESEVSLLPIVRNPRLSAIEKLQGFFTTLDRLRLEQKASVVALLRVWYTDDNAIVRQKVDEAVFKQRAPLLIEVVRQGVKEGVFTTGYAEQAGEIILLLAQGMGNSHARLLLSFAQAGDERSCIEEIVTTHTAFMDAIERVLGMPSRSLHRTKADVVKVWLAALQGNAPA